MAYLPPSVEHALRTAQTVGSAGLTAYNLGKAAYTLGSWALPLLI